MEIWYLENYYKTEGYILFHRLDTEKGRAKTPIRLNKTEEGFEHLIHQSKLLIYQHKPSQIIFEAAVGEYFSHILLSELRKDGVQISPSNYFTY
jgi:hypothetical protein